MSRLFRGFANCLAVAISLGVALFPLGVLVFTAMAQGAQPASSYYSSIDLARLIYGITKVSQTDLFWTSARNSFYLAIPAAVVGVAVAYVLTIGLKLVFSRAIRWIFFWLLMAPLFSNYYLRTFATRIAIGDTGVWPSIWNFFGGAQDSMPLLFTMQGVLLYLIVVSIPYAFVFVFVAMESIRDPEIAAARNLGASTMKIISTLMLPRTRAGLVIGGIAAFVFVFGDHVAAGIIGGNRTYIFPLWTVDLWKENDFPSAAAVALWQTVVLLVPIFAVASWAVKTNKD